MAVVRRIRCVISGITDHGERVYTIELEPSSPAPPFKPGQFLHLAIDTFDGAGFWPESRVFSIASSPRERDRLTITYAAKGAFTSRMERELTPGTVVWIKLPYGDFTVDDKRDAILFAGGTGITAFTAFLESLMPERKPQVRLYYGAKTADLFVYGPLVSRKAAEVSALTAALVSEETDGRLSADAAWPETTTLHAPLFYLSGPPAMITALRGQLQAHGVIGDDIRTDEWE